MPESFVVPASLSEADIGEICVRGGRIPFWSWSHRRGSSLCRMSGDSPDGRFVAAVERTNARANSPPFVLDLLNCGKAMTLSEVRRGYETLKRLCAVGW